MKKIIKKFLMKCPVLFDWVKFFYYLLSMYKMHGNKCFWLPTALDIETNNQCNLNCWYCPKKKNKKLVKMPLKIFKKIINTFSQLGFRGRVSLHSFNEPLTDWPRLKQFIKYVKEKLPKSKLVIYTNGVLLTEEILVELISLGVDSLTLSLHDRAPVEPEKYFYLKGKYPDFIATLNDFRPQTKNTTIGNRGNQIHLKKWQHIIRCYNIFTLVIRASGKIVLCCQDCDETDIMATVNDDLEKFLKSKKRLRIIWDVFFKKRFPRPLCHNCGIEA